jgi:hypothetical protein
MVSLSVALVNSRCYLGSDTGYRVENAIYGINHVRERKDQKIENEKGRRRRTKCQ